MHLKGRVNKAHLVEFELVLCGIALKAYQQRGPQHQSLCSSTIYNACSAGFKWVSGNMEGATFREVENESCVVKEQHRRRYSSNVPTCSQNLPKTNSA
jgi:ABC-type enterobactin transport system permease subunit